MKQNNRTKDDTRRRIFFLSSARSDYDILHPIIVAVKQDPRLDAQVIAAAGQMSPFHGLGVELIRSDGHTIAGEVESLLGSETCMGRALSFVHLTEGLTHLLQYNRPDILFIMGDREEALAGAIVANFLGIHVAHLHGGDRCNASGIDEVLRPAISKLSHLHFTAMEAHRERLIRMGEPPELVWTTGAPGLDRLRTEAGVEDEVLKQEFGIDVTKPYFLLIYNPSPLLDPEKSGEEMAQVLKGVLALGHPVFCSYPNYDPGNIAMRRVIANARLHSNLLFVMDSLPRSRFVALYRRCSAIVGNSSSIVFEAGFLCVPGILVGDRQNLRMVGENVLRVPATALAVKEACERALGDPAFRKAAKNSQNLYGDGYAAPRIAKVLSEVRLTPAMLRKTITY